jgi:hypothetical protein
MSHNRSAIALYRRTGYENEGIKRGSIRIDSRSVDEVLMAKSIDPASGIHHDLPVRSLGPVSALVASDVCIDDATPDQRTRRDPDGVVDHGKGADTETMSKPRPPSAWSGLRR